VNTKTLKALALAALFAGPALLVGSGASAHAKLVKANPAAASTVGAPPTLELQFSEKLEPKFSGVELMTLKGDDVPVTSAVSDKTVTVTPKAPLKPGAYMVMWKAVAADDGHKTKGDYNFVVK
jgi:methionine-rich copper-binding protein CopC